jgi:hypothetical protein
MQCLVFVFDIWGLQRDNYEEYCHLGCNAVCSGINLPTSHRSILPQTLGFKFNRNKETISFLRLLLVWRILSSGMLHHRAPVRTEVLEVHIASILRVIRISELGTALAVTSNWSTLQRVFHYTVLRLVVTANIAHSFPIDEGGARFLQNVGSYKNHTT